MTHPRALSFRILKKWRPLDIPFDPSLIRTGDCLVRIGLGAVNGECCSIRTGQRLLPPISLGAVNGNQFTAHILPEKYPALKAVCPGGDSTKPKHKIPKDIEKTWDTIDGSIKPVRQTVDGVAESPWDTAPVNYWTIPTAIQFNCDEWEKIISWDEFRASVPREPQTPPSSVKNANEYKWIIDGSLPFMLPIPNIRKKTQAKTDNGRKRFGDKMLDIWSDRKRLFLCGLRLLRDAGFFKHSRDVLGQVDARNSCPRCGSNVFVPKGRKNLQAKCPPATVREKLTCYDCGYVPKERTYRIKSADIKTEVNEGLHCDNGRNPPLLRLTPQEFVAALLIDGRLDDIADGDERRKISASYLQLCEGWLPADVKKESGFDDEQESAIRQRAARLMSVLLKHKQANKLLPTPSAEEIAYLNENMDVTEIVT